MKMKKKRTKLHKFLQKSAEKQANKDGATKPIFPAHVE